MSTVYKKIILRWTVVSPWCVIWGLYQKLFDMVMGKQQGTHKEQLGVFKFERVCL